MSPESLTLNQQKVLALLSAGSTLTHAAESVGIHRNTVANWRRLPAFREAIDHASAERAAFWAEQAAGLAIDAVAAIRAILSDPKTPVAVRLKAAQFILEKATSPLPSVNRVSEAPPPEEVCQEIPATSQPAQAGFVLPEAADHEIMHTDAQSCTTAAATYSRPSPKTGRNDACPCGSGRKFKRCCLAKIGHREAAAAAA
jgi:hypothetical protein